ncbi:MAG: BofC C-terminal domain-containing protein [Selenomonadales bacterium]|nr:BofC C-terminal domain-containing protein [Selenomonadales bacterium]MBQ5831988.1 BofC C-terminal domain-containing protein [Selenomonadales bacterium]
MKDRYLTMAVCFCMVMCSLWMMTGSVDRPDVDMPIGQTNERVGENTMFEQTIYYRDCKESEVVREKASAKVVGMTRDEVAELYREWQITSFDKDVVALQIAVDDVCKEHKKEQFVGMRDGIVGIYYGKPNEDAILKENLTLDTTMLIEEAQEALKVGIPFRSEEEKLRILEGLEAR